MKRKNRSRALLWGVVIGMELLSFQTLGEELVATEMLSIGPELTPVRRTTIVTADAEASLRFYRDILGFTVAYDQAVTDGGQLALLAPGATEGRAIALSQGGKLGGSIGLFWTTGLPAQTPCESPAPPGAVSVLLLTNDLTAMRARLDAAGVLPVRPPVSYDKSRGPTDVYAVFDPNCVRVSIAEIKNETLEESLNK
jgi:catechol 2,3-dioxygenase-like lactoylglutathione lyase family enzyme